MRVIFNQQYEPIKVVSETAYQQMLDREEVNDDQVLIN